MLRFLSSILCLVAGFPALADISTYGAFKYSSDAPGVLVLAGPIGPNSVPNFRKALRTHRPEILFLLSPGGNVQSGLELSAIIGDRGMSTVIPPGGECASACSFLFVAGEKRRAYGRLGVHQFSSNGDLSGRAAEQTTQQVTAEIIDYLKEYDVPAQFLVRMLETPPNSMYWFPVDELREHGIETLSTFPTELEQVAGIPALTRPVATEPAQPAPPPAPQEQEPEVAIAPAPAAPINPSFDCRKAATGTEFAICGSPDIARMDRIMAQRYRSLRASMDRNAAQALQSSQRNWLNRRNRCGNDLNCLSVVYRTRLSELGL
ncbi:lysozyme inhibitor LprI family protein [Actibacterium sp. 188UL27-1]|uniref:lysozyme inhibitor LprI family protein n=1 Tax=Actibacterium sp. 188UL27-1 TaxID=2786961 RepID=UPI0019565674|nr:lysozyme inhibitor LprI family protein [Actibacterium sp. 188UL27-1]MBM7068733.1 DUF1311 domain-containing protein [Actibacterium sp. 188UL27-1]